MLTTVVAGVSTFGNAHAVMLEFVVYNPLVDICNNDNDIDNDNSGR